MPFNDGIPKIRSFSLTDFHDFDECTFRFLVRHTLDKKYEIDKGNEAMALGNLLDLSIKKFHMAKYYGCEPEALEGLVRASDREMREQVKKAQEAGRHQFYETSVPFLNEYVISQAVNLFTDYYKALGKKIKPAIGEVGFCEWIFTVNKERFKLWGGPDTLEMGDDGLPEVADYKSRQNLERGKMDMDMDLMPKIYVLLLRSKLIELGYKRARFVVRFWQDFKEDQFNEEFDLLSMEGVEDLIRQKVEEILKLKKIQFCEDRFCVACQSDKREEFLKELKDRGFFLQTIDNDLPF